MIRSMVSLLMMAATVSACATKTTAGPSQLPGRDWRLVAVGGQSALPADAARRPWLNFSTDSNRVSGHLGCNRASGTFTMNGAELRFGPIMSTRMACADDAMNRQEAALGGALQGTDHFRITGDTLELLQASTVLARFARAP
jgi:heat shock protein HslJ